jgi:predicted RNA-binding Zn-ribbon protein involved in translation (DUF1610 family)
MAGSAGAILNKLFHGLIYVFMRQWLSLAPDMLQSSQNERSNIMKTSETKPKPTKDRPKEPAKEEATADTDKNTASSLHPNFFAQQYSTEEGGIPTDMYCPACGEEIRGSHLPIFMCPHCENQIWRDDNGNVTNYEQKHTCPECGHTFGDMTDEAPTEFSRIVRNFEQKTESVFLGFDRIVNRIFA